MHASILDFQSLRQISGPMVANFTGFLNSPLFCNWFSSIDYSHNYCGKKHCPGKVIEPHTGLRAMVSYISASYITNYI